MYPKEIKNRQLDCYTTWIENYFVLLLLCICKVLGKKSEFHGVCF
jgi:hypothetical protein